MNDTYIELLVKKPDSKTATLLHKIMIGVGAVLFLAGLFTYLVFMLLGLVLLIGSIIPMLFTDIEYEYLLLGKEFTVDRIRKKENRKTVADYDLGTMVVMAPKGSEQLKRYEQLKVVDYSSDSEEGNPYEIVVDGKAGKVRVLVDTTQELVDTIRRMSPRNVY